MQLHFNNVVCNFIPDEVRDDYALGQLPHLLCTMAPGAIYTPQYRLFRKTKGARGWSGKVSLCRDRKILTGLIPKVLHVLADLGCNVVLVDQRPVQPVELKEFPSYLRDYQKDAIQAFIEQDLYGHWFPRGVIQAATGAGKTLLAAALLEMLPPVRTIFLVHRIVLMEQTYEVFKKQGLPVGRIGDGILELDQIQIATVQTMASFKKNRPELYAELCPEIKAVIIDEAHLAAAKLNKGNQFVLTVSDFENAFIRLGLTATAFLRDAYSNWLLEGVTGPKVYEIRNKELINRGVLAKPHITMIQDEIPPHVISRIKLPRYWPEAYEEGVVKNERRNRIIVDQMKTIPKPALVMVQRIAHGKIIQAKAKSLGGMDVPFVWGEDETIIKMEVIEGLRNGSIPVAIASTIFDEGIDIPDLRGLILAGGMKSVIKGLQRIGRGLRKTKDKTTIAVIDFYDAQPPVLKAHSESRLRLWEEEGFEIKRIGSDGTEIRRRGLSLRSKR